MRMRRYVSAALSGGLTPAADLTLLTAAVILMLGGAVMLLVGMVGDGIAIPLIAVGIGVTAIVELDKRRHRDDR
jgi:hypothetical protein